MRWGLFGRGICFGLMKKMNSGLGLGLGFVFSGKEGFNEEEGEKG